MIIVDFTCLIAHSLAFIERKAKGLKKMGRGLCVFIDRESHTNAHV